MPINALMKTGCTRATSSSTKAVVGVVNNIPLRVLVQVLLCKPLRCSRAVVVVAAEAVEVRVK